MLYLNSVTMYIQCCLALWSCMPLIHLALVYIVYHFIRSQTVICHQSQTVTFVHDQKCFEIDLSNGQISSRMLLRIFNPLLTNTPYGANIYFSQTTNAPYGADRVCSPFFFFSSFHFYLFSKPFVSI